jgi:hypothetical protein
MTPLSAVRDAYVKLFPDRARRAGVTADVVRPECVCEGEPAPRP